MTDFNTEVGAGAAQPQSLKKDQLYIQHAAGSNKVLGLWGADKGGAIKCILNHAVVFPGDGNDYSMKAEDKLVGADTTTSACTITLPATAKIEDGHEVIIEDHGGNATTNNVTIATPGSETTETASLATNDATARLVWDAANTNWKAL